jgi:hypothetical protein
MGPAREAIAPPPPKVVNADFRVRRAYQRQTMACIMDIREQSTEKEPAKSERKKKSQPPCSSSMDPETEGF